MGLLLGLFLHLVSLDLEDLDVSLDRVPALRAPRSLRRDLMLAKLSLKVGLELISLLLDALTAASMGLLAKRRHAAAWETCRCSKMNVGLD